MLNTIGTTLSTLQKICSVHNYAIYILFLFSLYFKKTHGFSYFFPSSFIFFSSFYLIIIYSNYNKNKKKNKLLIIHFCHVTFFLLLFFQDYYGIEAMQ